MFNQSGGLQTGTSTTSNPMQDYEVVSPPDDSVSSLAFSPACIPQNFLVAGSWDCNVRCWEVEQSGKTVPKSMQSMAAPVLDVCWSDDGTKVFMASCDKTAKCWDLASNQSIQVAAHDAPIKTCHWIKASTYSCLMTGSWDKTLRDYPMAVVGTAGRGLIVYQLEGSPREYKSVELNLKYQYRCVAIFRDKKKVPTGFAIGSTEGRVAIHHLNLSSKENFTFKCHRTNGTPNGYQDIYAVNDIAFHPVHGTVATVGGDGTFGFWDKDARTKLKSSEPMEQPITRCCFNHNGQIFAYAVSYDWSK
ncbi:unnamed protein product, partial [Heterotrigona itama]